MHSGARKALAWILMGFVVVWATRFYYVREVLAVLALVMILLGCALLLLLLGITLDWATKTLLRFVELRAREVLRHAHTVPRGSERLS